MSCLEPELVFGWIESRLTDDERREVEAHVDGCETCRQLFAALAKATPEEEAAIEPAAEHETGPLEPGDRLGRYELVSLIGRGGMGLVYLAIDPELERNVALKVMRPRSDADEAELESRLKREARVLAKLSHPNVIAVHDVGSERGRLFLAMELVEGMTLRRWLRSERTLEEILEVFRAAGRGLAAAHSAGVVHRDFKPDNVLVGNDGRVRVSDFGLSRWGSSTEESLSPSTASDSELTEEGAVLGTPAYLSPEQRSGRSADARSDQYTFCLVLSEALSRKGHRRAPRSILRALGRGLEPDPAARHESMQALLKALAPARSRALLASAGGVLMAVSAAAGFLLLGPSHSPLVCDDPEHGLGDAWSPKVQRALRSAFEASKLPYASNMLSSVQQRLDAHAKAWTETAIRACKSDAGTDPVQRMRLERCLARHRAELVATVEMLRKGGAPAIERAVDAVARLSRPSECSGHGVRTSTSAESLLLEDALTRARAKGLAGQIPASLAELRKITVRAAQIRDRALEAEALYLQGQVEAQDGALVEAGAALRKAARAAEATHQDALVAKIRIEEVVLAAQALELERGKELVLDARAALERVDGREDLEASLLTYEGFIANVAGDRDTARRCYQRAIALQERPGSDELLLTETLEGFASMRLDSFELEEAKALYQRVVEIRTRVLGRQHPMTANTIDRLGGSYWELGDLVHAESLMREALIAREAALGPDNPAVAESLNNLGEILRGLGRFEEAEAMAKRAVVIAEARYGPEHPFSAVARMNLGDSLRESGRVEEALKEHRHVVEIFRRWEGGTRSELAMALYYAAEDLAFTGRCKEALPLHREGLAVLERNSGLEHPDRAFFLTAIAECEIEGGDAPIALKLGEEALAIREATPMMQGDLARTRFVLARALMKMKRDRVRARSLVDAAEEEYRRFGPAHARALREVSEYRARMWQHEAR